MTRLFVILILLVASVLGEDEVYQNFLKKAIKKTKNEILGDDSPIPDFADELQQTICFAPDSFAFDAKLAEALESCGCKAGAWPFVEDCRADEEGPATKEQCVCLRDQLGWNAHPDVPEALIHTVETDLSTSQLADELVDTPRQCWNETRELLMNLVDELEIGSDLDVDDVNLISPVFATCVFRELRGACNLRIEAHLISQNVIEGPQPDRSLCKRNSPAMRFRQDLGVSRAEAEAGFSSAFGRYTNEAFAPKISYGLSGFRVSYSLPGYMTTHVNRGEPGEGRVDWVSDYTADASCATAAVSSSGGDGDGNEHDIDVFWAAGLETDDDGRTYLFLAQSNCTMLQRSVAPAVANFFCHELFAIELAVNVKRFACVVRNHRAEDPLGRCGGLDLQLGADDGRFDVDNSIYLNGTDL